MKHFALPESGEWFGETVEIAGHARRIAAGPLPFHVVVAVARVVVVGDEADAVGVEFAHEVADEIAAGSAAGQDSVKFDEGEGEILLGVGQGKDTVSGTRCGQRFGIGAGVEGGDLLAVVNPCAIQSQSVECPVGAYPLDKS